MRKNLIHKHIILKLDKYRRLIRTVNLIDFYKNQILLVCYCIHFHGYSLKILREYYCSKLFELYNYKDNFDFVIISAQNQNYLYNYKVQKALKKTIFFFFKNFDELYLFYYRIRTFTLSPYFFFPLFLSTPLKNVLISFGLFSKYLSIGEYKYYKHGFVYDVYLKFIKYVFSLLFVNIFFLISNFKCQH